MSESTNCRFPIGFYEFSFLVEACIPPRPAARSMFWMSVIDKHYHAMTIRERQNLFEWITTNANFDVSNEYCKWFYDRFSPRNQHTVKVNVPLTGAVIECFKHGERYYTTMKKFISPESIIDVQPINIEQALKCDQ